MKKEERTPRVIIRSLRLGISEESDVDGDVRCVLGDPSTEWVDVSVERDLYGRVWVLIRGGRMLTIEPRSSNTIAVGVENYSARAKLGREK